MNWCFHDKGPLPHIICQMSPLIVDMLPLTATSCMSLQITNVCLRLQMWIPGHLYKDFYASIGWKMMHCVWFTCHLQWTFHSPSKSFLLGRNTVTPGVFYKLLLAMVQNAEKLSRHIPCSCCNLYRLISYFTRGIKIMVFAIIVMMMMTQLLHFHQRISKHFINSEWIILQDM